MHLKTLELLSKLLESIGIYSSQIDATLSRLAGLKRLFAGVFGPLSRAIELYRTN